MSEPTPINPEIRSVKNTTGATLAKGTIVKLKTNPAVPREVEPAADGTNPFFGVVMEDILDGEYGNVQIRGSAAVLCSAALTVGGLVTAGTGGKAKNATVSDYVLGQAVTAGGADQLAEVELAGPAAGIILVPNTIDASGITFTPPAGMSSTNLQDAVEEVWDKEIMAEDVAFDPDGTGLVATDLQAAVVELDGKDAGDITFDPGASGLSSTNVNDAIIEVNAKI